MEAILRQARELARALHAHERARAFRAAREAVAGNEESLQLVRDRGRIEQEKGQYLASGKAVPDELRRREAELVRRVEGDEPLLQSSRAYARFQELVDEIHELLAEAVHGDPN